MRKPTGRDTTIQCVFVALSPDWATGSQIAVAIATLILAGVTVRLAALTRRTAMAAEAAAQAASAQVDHQTSPLLIEAPPRVLSDAERVAFFETNPSRVAELISFADGYEIRADLVQNLVVVREHGGRGYVSLPVRNVGNGLAVVTDAVLANVGTSLGGVVSQPNVPPGETSRLSFIVPPDDDEWGDFYVRLEPVPNVSAPPLKVFVRYTDLAGGRQALSQFDISRPANRRTWRVARVAHRDDRGTDFPWPAELGNIFE